MRREAFGSKENYKFLRDWHVIQVDSKESNWEIIFPNGISQKIKDFIEDLGVDSFPTIILYGLEETEETFRMNSYLTNYRVKSTLQYICS